MKLHYISWIPAFLLMVFIFLFSSKPAVDSNEGSMEIAKSVLTMYEKAADVQYEQQERLDILETINHFLRKSAHFCEYAILAIAFAIHMIVLKKRAIWLFFIPVFLSAVYASTDEYHQTFVAGRSGQLSDVLLDTSGAAAGAAVFLIIMLICKRISNCRSKVV